MVSRAQPDLSLVRAAIQDVDLGTGDPTELVLALRTGEAGAPATLFDRYGAGIHRVLIRIIGDDPESSDLLHDTFLRALDHIGELRNLSALKSWLNRMVVFIA